MRSIFASMQLVVLSVLIAVTALSNLPDARAAEPLRWRLESGTMFDYVVVQDSAMTMTGAPSGEPMNMTMHQQMDTTWNVQSVDAGGNAVISQSVKRVRMTMNAPGGQGFQYDSDADEAPTGMAAMIAPLYEAMMEGEVQLTLTPRGEIRDVKIPDKMLAAVKNLPGAAAMGDMATAEGFKNIFTQGSMVLPEEAPTPGQKWTSSVDTNNPMMGKMTVETTYEYKGTKDVDGATFAVIAPTVTTKIEGNASLPMTIKDQTSGGEILFNQAAGRIHSSLVKQGMTIDAKVGEQAIQQTIDQTINVTFTPVKE